MLVTYDLRRRRRVVFGLFVGLVIDLLLLLLIELLKCCHVLGHGDICATFGCIGFFGEVALRNRCYCC